MTGTTLRPSASCAEDGGDAGRRRLLEESDQLLDRVEQLQLADATSVPDSLHAALAQLQERLGRRQPPPAPATLRAAHSLVFAVQQRLMAANPRNPGTRSHAGRAAGAPRREEVTSGATWKVLTLPPRPAGAGEAEWLELVEATVERALQRWAYAQHQAARAARESRRAAAELRMAGVAWRNYFDLMGEAESIRANLSARPGAAPPPRGR